MNDRSRSTTAERAVLIVTIAGSAMAFIDSSAVNVALPVMQRGLHASAADLQWIVEGYALFLSALILTGGALGDRFGQRTMFVIGITLFALASIACGFAPTSGLLIAARCIQGVGAAIFVPGSLALISENFSGAERGKAIGTWSGFSAITTAFGPVLGGWLAQTFTWRAVFFINIPLAIVVLIVSLAAVPKSKPSAGRRVDVGGALLATLGLGAITFSLIESQQHIDHTRDIWLGIIGAVTLIFFFVFERRWARVPMMQPALFASKPFVGANIYTLLLYAALGGSLYFVPFDLINVQHYQPVAAGASLLPFVAIMSTASRWSGGLVDRIGSRIPLLIGASIAAIAFLLYARMNADGGYWLTVFPAAVALGIAGAFFVAPLTTTVMSSVDNTDAGAASGINNAAARVAGLIAVAALGFALAVVFDAHLASEVRSGAVPSQTQTVIAQQRDTILSGAIDVRNVPLQDRAPLEAAVQRAYASGFSFAMICGAGLCVIAALFSALWDWRPSAKSSP
jgi:EmrB/QacA subfamily drug resistance transporter